jgi:hypothetical protein
VASAAQTVEQSAFRLLPVSSPPIEMAFILVVVATALLFGCLALVTLLLGSSIANSGVPTVSALLGVATRVPPWAAYEPHSFLVRLSTPVHMTLAFRQPEAARAAIVNTAYRDTVAQLGAYGIDAGVPIPEAPTVAAPRYEVHPDDTGPVKWFPRALVWILAAWALAAAANALGASNNTLAVLSVIAAVVFMRFALVPARQAAVAQAHANLRPSRVRATVGLMAGLLLALLVAIRPAGHEVYPVKEGRIVSAALAPKKSPYRFLYRIVFGHQHTQHTLPSNTTLTVGRTVLTQTMRQDVYRSAEVGTDDDGGVPAIMSLVSAALVLYGMTEYGYARYRRRVASVAAAPDTAAT